VGRTFSGPATNAGATPAAIYPARPKFFACRFCQLMTQACLANEIGPEACWLLTVVVNTEDAKHYSGPVTFFNEQLLPMVGLGSVDALARVRAKLVETGWLVYVRPHGRRAAGRYWVTIPGEYLGVDDAPTDEFPEKYTADPPAVDSAVDSALSRNGSQPNSAFMRNQPRIKCGTNRESSAEPSSLTCPLSLDPPTPQGASGSNGTA